MGTLYETTKGILESELEALPLPNSCIWSYLATYLQRWKNLTAFICSQTQRSYTYSQLTEGSLRWAEELLSHSEDDVPPTVAIICPNNIDYPMIFLGAAAIGAPVVGMRSTFTKEHTAYILEDTKTSVVVMDIALKDTLMPTVKSVGGSIKKIYFWTADHRSDLEYGENETFIHHILHSENQGLDINEAKMVCPDKLLYIAFSTGTTGKPKGILHTHRSTTNLIHTYMDERITPIKFPQGDVQECIIANLPNFTGFGLQYYFVAVLTRGCRVVAFESMEAMEFAEAIQKYQATILTMHPHMIEGFSKLPLSHELDSVHFMLNIASRPNQDAVERLNAKLKNPIIVADGYGSTESCASIQSPLRGKREGTTGKVLPGVKVKFVDADTRKVITKPNCPGEMLINSKWVMKEYLNNPEATARVFQNGWFCTGDIGYFDQDNFITVMERKIDLINVNGNMVYPTKIEERLSTNKFVHDVGVIGIIDHKTGTELPKAFVVPIGSSVKPEDIALFMEETSPPEMWLRGNVTFVKKLPRNHLGKLQRKMLRNWHWNNSVNII